MRTPPWRRRSVRPPCCLMFRSTGAWNENGSLLSTHEAWHYTGQQITGSFSVHSYLPSQGRSPAASRYADHVRMKSKTLVSAVQCVGSLGELMHLQIPFKIYAPGPGTRETARILNGNDTLCHFEREAPFPNFINGLHTRSKHTPSFSISLYA